MAVPAAAETVDSGTTTAGTEAPADPVPDMVLARPPPGALHGNPEVKAAAAKVAAMEEATEAATAETTAAATAAMKLQANVAEATAGEVAAADGSAATPATASTSHSPLTSLHTLSSSIVYSFFKSKICVAICVQQEKRSCCI